MSTQSRQEELSRAVSQLCQACALCCSGVIFTRVTLLDDDPLLTKVEMRYYAMAHLPASDFIGAAEPFLDNAEDDAPRTLDFPCMFLKDRRCKEYKRRPARCQEYECILAWQVSHGKIPYEWARGILLEALRLYAELCERLKNVDKGRGFWINARRMAMQPDFTDPSVYSKLGVESETVPLLQEFAAFLDEHFHPTPPAPTDAKPEK